MQKHQFLSSLQQAMEIKSPELNEDTQLSELKEFDSTGVLMLIGFVDKHFQRSLTQEEIKSITTVRSLMDIIGEEHFD